MLLGDREIQALRSVGIKVVETTGWRTRSHGQLPDSPQIVWHHDASPPGDSPGALSWMISNWPSASAQVWVDRYGTWHLVGNGVAWHAGKVLSGMPGNFDAIGIETDHTTGEGWPVALLDSLRAGTAALLKLWGRKPSTALHFHKTICSPPGRKSDPDGLELAAERQVVGALMTDAAPVEPNTPSGPSIPAPHPISPQEDIAMLLVETYGPSKQGYVGLLDGSGRITWIKGSTTDTNLRARLGQPVRIDYIDWNDRANVQAK